jgi:uncharacterized protein (PEP-CTERM system associated)
MHEQQAHVRHLSAVTVRGRMNRLLPVVLVASLVIAPPVIAAEWDIVPALTVRGTYTDNFALEPDVLKQTEWVTQVIPEITMNAVGSGLKFNLYYAPEITRYARDQEDDTTFQRGSATGTAELADDLFFIDAGASVDQYNVSLFGPLTDGNANATNNRATVGTFFASPYLVHRFGSAAQIHARYTYSIWNSDDQSQFNNSANAIDLGLASGSSFRVLNWSLTYEKASVDYETQSDLDSELALATVRRPVAPTLALLGQVGDENYERVISGTPTGEADGGSRWGVGLEWVPSPRSRLAAAGGERFFGDAYFLDLSYRTRLLLLTAGYTQDVTTSRTEFFTTGFGGVTGSLSALNCAADSDPEECEQEVEEEVAVRGINAQGVGPVNFFSADPFLQKRLQASLTMQGVRNIIVVTVFSESREVLPGFNYESGDLASGDTIDQTGVSLGWNLPISGRLFWNLGSSYERNDFDSGRVDDLTTLTMGLTRQFQPKLSGSLFYRGQQNDSTDPVSSYTENAVTATLRMEF